MKHKFNAVPTERYGIKFPSKLQAKRYDQLQLLKRAGDVVFFLMEVPFNFPGGKWRCDFMVFWKDGNITVEDVKGYDTAESKRVRRIVEANYPIEVQVIK